MTLPEIADRQFTIEYYLDRSARTTLPLALGFLQRQEGNGRPAAGPFSVLVRRGRESALEQYLLLHAIASNGREGFDVRLPASAWARAIGGYIDPKTGRVDDAGLHAVSRNWKLLRELRLVETERAGRQVKARLLADDGSGRPYQHVAEGKKGQKLEGSGYLQLPYLYWRQRWHVRLSLPAKAMLLIALYQGDGFALPYNKLPEWYGVSPSTGERGLRELRESGLLHREQHRRPDPESPVGFSYVYHYELLKPFGPRNRLSKSASPRWIGSSPRLSLASGEKRKKARKTKARKASKRRAPKVKS